MFVHNTQCRLNAFRTSLWVTVCVHYI